MTCCLKCNGRKGSLPLSQLRLVGMKLDREPFIPSQYELASRAARMVPKRVHATWKPYLGFAAESSMSGKNGIVSPCFSSKDQEMLFGEAE